jgi:hypothetical protein
LFVLRVFHTDAFIHFTLALTPVRIHPFTSSHTRLIPFLVPRCTALFQA